LGGWREIACRDGQQGKNQKKDCRQISHRFAFEILRIDVLPLADRYGKVKLPLIRSPQAKATTIGKVKQENRRIACNTAIEETSNPNRR